MNKTKTFPGDRSRRAEKRAGSAEKTASTLDFSRAIMYNDSQTRTGIEAVITALTRNQVYQQWYRGFESHPVRHENIPRPTGRGIFS